VIQAQKNEKLYPCRTRIKVAGPKQEEMKRTFSRNLKGNAAFAFSRSGTSIEMLPRKRRKRKPLARSGEIRSIRADMQTMLRITCI
jgi:hypothetical protein